MRCSSIFIFCFSFCITLYAQEKTGLTFTNKRTYNRVGFTIPPIIRDAIPVYVDLSDKLPPVGNQSRQNSCVGWALGYATRSYYNIINSCYDSESGQYCMDESNYFSPAFIYNMLNKGKNSGVSLYKALQLIKDTGVCTMSTMPYDEYDYKTVPNSNQIKEANRYKIQSFKKLEIKGVDSLRAIANLKSALISGQPITCATPYDNTFFDKGYFHTGGDYIWSKCDSKNSMGHAIVLVGYSDSLKAFKFRNSFGEKWGNKGYGWISYAIIQNVLREAYVIKPYPERTTVAKKPSVTKVTANPFNRIPQDSFNKYFSGDTFGKVLAIADKFYRSNTSGIYTHNVSVCYDTVSVNRQVKFKPYIRAAGAYTVKHTAGQKINLAVVFYYAKGGKKDDVIISNNKEYQLGNGQLAMVAVFDKKITPGEDVKDYWTAEMPLDIFKRGKMQAKAKRIVHRRKMSHILAQPVLFVDDFVIAESKERLLRISDEPAD